MILNIGVREHSLVVQNVIDEYVVAVFLRLVVVIVPQDLATLVDDSLMKVFQVVALALILVVPGRQLENRVRINQRLVLQ